MRRILLEHAGVNDRLVQSKRFDLNQPKTQSPQDGSASNMRGFLKANGDRGLRSGPPIPSLAALNPRLTKYERGSDAGAQPHFRAAATGLCRTSKSPLPKRIPRSFPAFPALTAFPPI